MVCIYRITAPNSAVYIGQTWDINKRKKDYTQLNKIKQQRNLYNSMKLYGTSAHTLEILQHLPLDITQNELDQLEIFFIAQYRDCNFDVLNIRAGGSRGNHSDISKEKISNSLKGRKRDWKPSKEHIEKLVKCNTGKKRPKELVEKIINNRRKNGGYIITEETRKKLSESHKGQKMSEDKKEKIRIGREKYLSEPANYSCIYCGKDKLRKGTYKLWHGEKCKNKI